MPTKAEEVAEEMAKKLGSSKDHILKEGLQTFLKKKLREVKVDIYQIASKYEVSSVGEMEKLYQEGELEESASWSDFQRLDRLEYKKEQLSRLLSEME